MPETGNHLNETAKYKINIIPRKKDGIEIPTKTINVISLSIKEY